MTNFMFEFEEIKVDAIPLLSFFARFFYYYFFFLRSSLVSVTVVDADDIAIALDYSSFCAC